MKTIFLFMYIAFIIMTYFILMLTAES